MKDTVRAGYFAVRGFLASWVKTWQCMARLRRDFGHARSTRARMPVDREGQPLPWYTYPCIEYLSQLDLRDKSVFEFGSGNSSLFWAARARQVVSIENDAAWHALIVGKRPANLDLRLRESEAAYVASILEDGRTYDVIVVDGAFRAECAARAARSLAPGGLIILDNSDWFVKSAAILRAAGLLQVDMKGFGPINGYAWSTTLFFHRDFAGRSLEKTQPSPGWGSVSQAVAE